MSSWPATEPPPSDDSIASNPREPDEEVLEPNPKVAKLGTTPKFPGLLVFEGWPWILCWCLPEFQRCVRLLHVNVFQFLKAAAVCPLVMFLFG